MELSVTLPIPSADSGHREAAGRPTASPLGRRGRPFFVDTKLGQIIDARGLKVKDVVNGSNMNPRTMSDYLSARKPISAPNKLAIAKYLGIRPEELD